MTVGAIVGSGALTALAMRLPGLHRVYAAERVGSLPRVAPAGPPRRNGSAGDGYPRRSDIPRGPATALGGGDGPNLGRDSRIGRVLRAVASRSQRGRLGAAAPTAGSSADGPCGHLDGGHHRSGRHRVRGSSVRLWGTGGAHRGTPGRQPCWFAGRKTPCFSMIRRRRTPTDTRAPSARGRTPGGRQGPGSPPRRRTRSSSEPGSGVPPAIPAA